LPNKTLQRTRYRAPLSFALELNQRDATLKKIMLLAIVLIAAWFFYGNKPADNRSVDRAQPEHVTQSINRGQESPQAASSFRCDGRVYCSQMASRAEAEFFLEIARTPRWTVIMTACPV